MGCVAGLGKACCGGFRIAKIYRQVVPIGALDGAAADAADLPALACIFIGCVPRDDSSCAGDQHAAVAAELVRML